MPAATGMTNSKPPSRRASKSSSRPVPGKGRTTMAGGREIKTKIKSVQNTRKVTRALALVSASKIRKEKDRLKSSLPYARAMQPVIGHIAQAHQHYPLGRASMREGVRTYD